MAPAVRPAGSQYIAELGWFDFRTRFYSPQCAQFCSRDHAVYSDGFGLYTAYVYSGKRDPFGTSFMPDEVRGFRAVCTPNMWDNGDWVDYYFFGGGEPIDLHNIGLFNYFHDRQKPDIDRAIGLIADSIDVPNCSKAGVFTKQYSGNTSFSSLNDQFGLKANNPLGYLNPSSKDWCAGILVDPLYSVGGVNPSISWSATLSWTCECCSGTFLHTTESNLTASFDFSLDDLFTNPFDKGGAHTTTSRPLAKCLGNCWDNWRRDLEKLEWWQLIEQSRVNRAFTRCRQGCIDKNTTTSELPHSLPYEIRAKWNEPYSSERSSPCP